MAKQFWEDDAPAASSSGSSNFWEGDAEAAKQDLPKDVKPSTAGGGRGTVNPPRVIAAMSEEEMARPAGAMGRSIERTTADRRSLLERSVEGDTEGRRAALVRQERRENWEQDQIDQRAPRATGSRMPAPDIAALRGEDYALSPIGGSAPGRVAGRLASGIAQGVGGMVQAAGDVIGAEGLQQVGRATAEGAAAFEKGMGKTGSIEGFGPRSPVPYLVEQGEGAATSLGQSAVLAAGLGARSVIGVQAALQAGQSYSEARAAGMAPGAALARAIPQGAFEAIGEKFQGLDKAAAAMGTLLNRGAGDAAKRTAADVLVKAGIREIPGEVLTYLGQSGVDVIPGIGLNPNMTMEQFLDGLRDTVVQSAMMGGAMAGGGHAARAPAAAQPIAAAMPPPPPQNAPSGPAAAPAGPAPVPTGEPPADMAAQLAAVRDPSSEKRAALITPRTPSAGIDLTGLHVVKTPQGNFVTRDIDLAREVAARGDSLTDDQMGQFLGYTTPKGASDGTVVQALDAQGNVVHEEVTNDQMLPIAAQQAQRMAPADGDVVVTNAVEAQQRRQDRMPGALERAAIAAGVVTPDGTPTAMNDPKARPKTMAEQHEAMQAVAALEAEQDAQGDFDAAILGDALLDDNAGTTTTEGAQDAPTTSPAPRAPKDKPAANAAPAAPAAPAAEPQRKASAPDRAPSRRKNRPAEPALPAAEAQPDRAPADATNAGEGNAGALASDATAGPVAKAKPNAAPARPADRAAQPPAAPVEQAIATYPSIEAATAHIRQQRARGTSLAAIPFVTEDGEITIAIKGTPNYERGLDQRQERLKKEKANVGNRSDVQPVPRPSNRGGRADAGGSVAPALGRADQSGPGAGAVAPAVSDPAESVRVGAAGKQPAAVDPATGREPASWVIRDKENGETLFETFDRAKVDALNTERYEAVPVGQHLQELNRKVAESSAIDEAAHEAATSPTNELPEPTQAQKEAGNYKMGHLSGPAVQGLDITIENPKGSERRGTSPDGKAWANEMGAHYGYVKRSEAADGDHVDIFVGPAADRAPKVWVVDQVNADGTYDEAKALFGFMNKTAAVRAYRSSYSKGWKVGPVTEMSVDEFKAGLESDRFKAPLSPELAKLSNSSISAQSSTAAPPANGDQFPGFFHGTAMPMESFEVGRGGGAGYHHQGPAVYLTDDRGGLARFFASAAAAKVGRRDKTLTEAQQDAILDSGGVVLNVDVAPDAKILDMRGDAVPAEVKALFDRSVGDRAVGDELRTKVLELGYDGIAFLEPNRPEGWETKPDAVTLAIYRPEKAIIKGDSTPTAAQPDAATQRVEHAAAKAKRVAAGNRARARAWEDNPARAFIAKHGIALDLAGEWAPGVAERRAAMVQGYGPIFRQAGMQLDTLAEAAVEEGFLLEPDEAQMHALIDKAIRKQRVVPLYAEGVAEGEMESRIAQQRQFEEDAYAALNDPLVSDEFVDALSESPLSWEEMNSQDVNALLQEIGASNEEIRRETEFLARQAERGAEGDPGAIEAAAVAAQAPDSAEGRAPNRDGKPAGGESGLASPSVQEVVAQQERAAQGERAEAAARRARAARLDADAQVGEFTLTGSDRAADANPDQGTMFSVADQTDSPAFKKWFGDSKVVDSEGRPLVVYHGTNADIAAFDPKAGKGLDNFVKDGIFFTEDAVTAGRYAREGGGANVIAAYVKIEKPLTFQDYVADWDETVDELLDEYGSETNFYDAHQDAILRQVRRGGHDGVIFSAYGDALVVAFRPEQIKSAIGNRGTFDPKNADIRMRTAEGTGAAIKTAPPSAEHERKAQKLLERLRGQQKAFLSFQAVEPNDTSDAAKNLKAARLIARRLFGHDVVFVRFNGPASFNGAMSGNIPNTVFIRVDSSKPHMAILGHELLHSLRQKNPGLYAAMEHRLKGLLSDKASAFYKDLQQKYRQIGRTMPEDWREELWADVVGDNFLSPEFWQDMAAEQPGLFRRVADAIVRFLDRIARYLANSTPFATDQFLTDVQAARRVVVAGMRQFSEEARARTGLARGDGASLSAEPSIEAFAEGSKVVDADGKPLRVYRGLSEPYAPRDGVQFWTDNREAAADYGLPEGQDTAAHMAEGYLSIKKPFEVSDDADAQRLAKLVGARWSEGDLISDILDHRNARAALEKAGYDGAIFDDSTGHTGREHRTFVTLRAEQAVAQPANDTRLSAAPEVPAQPTVPKKANPALTRAIFSGSMEYMRDQNGKPVKAKEQIEKYKAIDTDERGQMLLRLGHVTADQLKRWKASPLDIYDGAVNSRFRKHFESPGIVWKDEELRRIFKLDDEAIQAYRDLRATADTSIVRNAVADMLRLAGPDGLAVRERVLGEPMDVAAVTLRDHLLSLANADPERNKLLTDRANAVIDILDLANDRMGNGFVPDDMKAEARPNPWENHDPNFADRVIYELQDGKIDLKRTQEAIERSGSKIREEFDARLAETLYSGRMAKRTHAFLEDEARPLLERMAADGIGQVELGDYLHARAAPERNAQIAKVNPDMPDGGAGSNSTGLLLTTDAAIKYIADIPAERRAKLEALAQRVDGITKGTRALLVAEGLEKADTIAAWEKVYKTYVPMFREDVEFSRITTSKRATGSEKKAVNILANVLLQREAAITRAEKNRINVALYGLALTNPNPQFWVTIRPEADREQIERDVRSMGIDPIEAEAGMAGVPTIRQVDPVTDKVVEVLNPFYRNLPTAIGLKVNGEHRVLLLNENDERAVRMAAALKGSDRLTEFDLAGNIVGRATRWMAAVNTQYNVVFGLVNFMRDTMGGVIHLGNTELRGSGAQVVGNLPGAIRGIAAHLAGRHDSGKWSRMFEQFQQDGGQTGFREMFADGTKRAEAVERDLARMAQGRADPRRMARGLLSLLSGFNEVTENAVRLAAYAAALDKGMSRPQAARLARELTVDFNRKGRATREIGPLYAFFNAAVQGNERTLRALRGPTGRYIIAGGLALGVAQALMMAAAGYDDDEVPDYVKARALVIPLFNKEKGYILVPLPLGLHVIPNTGRVLTEMAIGNQKNLGKKAVDAIGEISGAFNPLGGGNIFTMDGALRTLAPTVIDPLIELGFNKNFAGAPIERETRGETDIRPGHQRARERTQRTASGQAYLGISKAINKVTGGTEYEAGAISPTAERIRYVSQVALGGVLREFERVVDTSVARARGEKTSPNSIPVASRFYGEVDAERVEQSRYYENMKRIDRVEASAKAARKAGDAEGVERAQQSPLYPFIKPSNQVEKAVRRLNKLAVQVIGSPEEQKAIDEAREAEMRSLNEGIREMERLRRGPTIADSIRVKK